MAIAVIWIDKEEAKFFHLRDEKMERRHFRARHHEHHSHALDNLDVKRQEQVFFTEIVVHLLDATRVLILGPGMAKHHFQTYLLEHQPGIAKKVVGCETVDHPSDAQITAYARKFLGMAEKNILPVA